MKVRDFLTYQEYNRIKILKEKMMSCTNKKEYNDWKLFLALILKNALIRYKNTY